MEIISASSKRIQDAISRVPRRNLFLRGDWRGYGFQHWRGSCQASSRDLSGQWSSLLCFRPVSTAYADDCLAAPNSAAPQGSHWYYRIEHATKLKCWYLRALDEAGHQSVAGARPGIASSVRLQSTDARSASQPGPSVGAPISLTLADSPRRVNKSTVKSHPVTSTVRNPDAESSGREDFTQSIPQARALQDSLQAEGANPLTKSAARAHVECSRSAEFHL
jgi:hypothetical protein